MPHLRVVGARRHREAGGGQLEQVERGAAEHRAVLAGPEVVPDEAARTAEGDRLQDGAQADEQAPVVRALQLLGEGGDGLHAAGHAATGGAVQHARAGWRQSYRLQQAARCKTRGLETVIQAATGGAVQNARAGDSHTGCNRRRGATRAGWRQSYRLQQAARCNTRGLETVIHAATGGAVQHARAGDSHTGCNRRRGATRAGWRQSYRLQQAARCNTRGLETVNRL